MFNFIFVIAVVSFTQETFADVAQTLTFYENKGCAGKHYTTDTNSTYPNMQKVSVKSPLSVSMTGIAVFYNAASYNGNVAYIYAPEDMENNCFNVTDMFRANPKAINSYRLIGDQTDYTASTITLFSGTYFSQGNPTLLRPADAMRWTALLSSSLSFAITGKDAWSLAGSSFTQTSCVPQFDSVPTLEHIYYNISSVKVGCGVQTGLFAYP